MNELKYEHNGSTLNYKVIGEGITVLLIHGFSPDHRLMTGCMEPVFNKINGFKRVYIDLPGMGKSTVTPEVSSADDLFEILTSFIKSVIGNEDFLIAGESFGGYLSRGILNIFPDRVKGLFLICPLIYPNPEDRDLPCHRVMERDDDFLETITGEEAQDFRDFFVIQTKEVYQRFIEEVSSGIKIANKEFLTKLRNNYTLSFDVDSKSWDTPVIFITGKIDSVVGYKDVLKILDRYKNSTYLALDRAGHNLQIEQPGIFTNIANYWFSMFL